MNKSIWNKYKVKSYKELDQDIKTEVLIIGGGLCGLLCGYYLKDYFDVVIVEKDRIASKKTLRTTASISALEDINYNYLKKKKGYTYAYDYYESNIYAINEYIKLSKKYNFDFDIVDSIKYSLTDEKEINLECKLLKSFGADCDLVEGVDIPINYKAAFKLKNQAQMNPILLVNEISKKLKIYENTEIRTIKKNIAFTQNNKIEAKYIIMCTGFPLFKLKGGFFYKLNQYKSFIITTNNKFLYKGNMLGMDSNDLYFRNYKDKLIIGGNDVRVGNNSNGFNSLFNFSIKNEFEIENCWINQDVMTMDKIAYIGRLNKHIFIATGFNMWGMTKSILAANIIQDLILENNNKYAYIYKLNRNLPVLKVLKNIFLNLGRYLKPTKKRCNHLGCSLTYVDNDNTYECLCHGSKFNENGDVLDGPATKNKKPFK